MTHSVSASQTAALMFWIVRRLRVLKHYSAVKLCLLLPELWKPSVTQHVVNRRQHLIVLAEEQTIRRPKMSRVWPSRLRWWRFLVCAVPLLLGTPTSARCWGCRALIDDCIYAGALGFLYCMWVFAEWKLISCEDTRVMNMEVFSLCFPKSWDSLISSLCSLLSLHNGSCNRSLF